LSDASSDDNDTPTASPLPLTVLPITQAVNKALRQTVPTVLRRAPSCLLRNAPLSLRPSVTLLRSVAHDGFTHVPNESSLGVHLDVIGLLNKMLVSAKNCPVCFETYYRCRKSGYKHFLKLPKRSEQTESVRVPLADVSFLTLSLTGPDNGRPISGQVTQRAKKRQELYQKVTRAGLGVFPCGHVVCWRCIGDLYKSGQGKCPLCREVTPGDSFPYPLYHS